MSEKRGDPIDLALEPDFRLGSLDISPSRRAALRGDWREVLEPRVMQVLVALYQGQGQVLSRDEMLARCWEGRIVGEDALNRAIGRLRRLSEADGGASFIVETIPRVGYRLVQAAPRPGEKPTPAAGPPSSDIDAAASSLAPGDMPRRTWLRTAVGATGMVALGGFAGWVALRRSVAPPDTLSSQMAVGLRAVREASPSALSEAVGIFGDVVSRFPKNADAWGGLALAYALQSHGVRKASRDLQLRASAAADRAISLDPHNGMALWAKGELLPRRSAWLEAERAFRQGLRFHPDNDGLWLGLAARLANAGRMQDAANAMRHALDNSSQIDPALAWNGIQIFWAANRLEEADHLALRAAQQFPRNIPAWFWRVYLLMFTGRADQALEMLNAVDFRPPGIPENNFAVEIAVSQALVSEKPDDRKAAQKIVMDSAHQGAGYAENAIMLLCALKDVDQAFDVAEALFFGRGFQLGAYRFSETQGERTPHGDERTVELFTPPAKLMRDDFRFRGLVKELGLSEYWKQTGSKPG